MGKNQAVEKAEYFAESIGRMAYQALLEEVYTVPKPGLVDPYSCGAHTDMDVQTFERSAEALYPWFVRMAYQGYQLTCTPEDLFREIRKTGMLAEEAMYRATGHVNTHKGMIFTLGIFSAAAGRCIQEDGTVTLQSILRMEQKMTARILRAEIEMLGKEPAKSNGEKNLVQYGTTGIRGEALAGYPSVFHIALPVLEDGLLRGMEWNRIKLQILFALMSRVQDHRYKRVNTIFTDTGFWDYVATLDMKREDFERAIDLAPSIKPFRHTYLHEEKYRRLAKEILWEDETLKRVFKQEK